MSAATAGRAATRRRHTDPSTALLLAVGRDVASLLDRFVSVPKLRATAVTIAQIQSTSFEDFARVWRRADLPLLYTLGSDALSTQQIVEHAYRCICGTRVCWPAG